MDDFLPQQTPEPPQHDHTVLYVTVIIVLIVGAIAWATMRAQKDSRRSDRDKPAHVIDKPKPNKPTDPQDPTDPINPIDPSDPQDPTDPIDPIDPIDPDPTVVPPTPGYLPAFPGAEGFGADTIGGRGGRVIKVTNTNHQGSGSLLEALESSGPRIVVFETGGTIDLKGDSIVIDDPYITIAGQTAPGDGVQIRNGEVRVLTHDVVVRGLRFRVGSESGTDTHRGVTIAGADTYNVILDHNSVSWGRGGNFYVLDQAHDIIFSWNIVAEALKLDGSKGLTHHKTAGENITSHHNILISNSIRNPQTKSLHNEVINNFVYNWGNSGTNVWLAPGSTANVINNMYVPGPDTRVEGDKGITVNHELNPRTNEFGTAADSLYLSGNIGPGRDVVVSTSLNEEWQAVYVEGEAVHDVQTAELFPHASITIHDAQDVQTILFASNGAGAIVPHRDPVDERILGTVTSDTGRIIATEGEVGGWSEFAAGIPPIDTDGDGMPDEWEQAHGSNASVADDAGDVDNDGYTNIEEYINSFFE